MEILEKCPICNSADVSLSFDCKDYFKTQENFSVYSCHGCGLLFTNPRPSESETEHYYNSENYLSHKDENKSLLNSIYKLVKNYTLSKKVKLINSLTSGRTILDIGSGTGAFLNKCKQNGWKVSGIEISQDARIYTKNKYNITDLHSDFESSQFSYHQFDCITMWHSLEHVYNFDKMMDNINNCLKPDGVLIIALPNPNSYDAIIYKKYWAAYDVPRHVYHFSKTCLKKLLLNKGFEITDTKPMKFDSYYISLLSEKYKNNKLAPLSAIIKGFISNAKATMSEYGYSSQIYIVKRK